MSKGRGTAHPDSMAVRISRLFVFIFVAVRLVHLIQGGIDLSVGWLSYLHPQVALAVLIGATVESALVMRQALRSGALRPWPAILDVVASAAGIALIGLATAPADRTTTLNWMLPYGVGAVVGLGFAVPWRRGLPLVCLLTAGYLATTWNARVRGGGHTAAALANAASYGAFWLVAVFGNRFAVGFATDYDHLRAQALETRERLTREEERRRHERIIHDSVLQTLEAIGTGRAGDDRQVRVRASQEARTLRQELACQSPAIGLGEALRTIADEVSAAFGLHVEMTSASDTPQPSPRVHDALVAATREALTNVAKHAGAPRAVVRARPSADGGCDVTIRDNGVGFDPAVACGFGIRESIRARMHEVGGRAEINSRPGSGTRVLLWGPPE